MEQLKAAFLLAALNNGLDQVNRNKTGSNCLLWYQRLRILRSMSAWFWTLLYGSDSF
jgi:hypothetical protein